MLETLNSLVKFAHLHNVFICDLVTTMKLCQDDLHKLYVAFNYDVSRGFHGLVETNHDDICIKWITNLNIGIDHLGFEFHGQHVRAKHKNMETRFNAFVTWL
jgi:hypothetical protein